MITINECRSTEQFERVAILAAEIWTEHYAPLIGTTQVEYMLGKFQSADAIKQQVSQEDYQYFEVFHDGTIAAYYAIKHDDNTIFLSKYYVHKNHRGLGIGRKILDRIISEASQKGASKIWLTVNKNNTNSIAAYQKMGFTIAEEIVTDIGNGYVMDDYKMELSVAGRAQRYRVR